MTKKALSYTYILSYTSFFSPGLNGEILLLSNFLNQYQEMLNFLDSVILSYSLNYLTEKNGEEISPESFHSDWK